MGPGWDIVRDSLCLRHTGSKHYIKDVSQPCCCHFQASHLLYSVPACSWPWISIGVLFLLQFSGLEWRIDCEWCGSSQTHIFLQKEAEEGAGTEIHVSLPAGSCGRRQSQCSRHLDGENLPLVTQVLHKTLLMVPPGTLFTPLFALNWIQEY